jgi:osmotically-inducible protein OsmY
MKDLGLGLVVLASGALLGGCVAAVIGSAPHSGTAADARARASASPDAALRSAVLERLGADAALRRAAIAVSAQGGVVTLRGSVSSAALRAGAASAARTVAGVIAVNNQLQVN